MSYPDNWPEIARAVKDAAGWRCVRCQHEHSPSDGYCLTVHHLDMDKANCVWWNLVALCQRCHLHIQAKVIMERPWMFEHTEWFKPHVAGYLAHHVLNEDLTREQVMDRLDGLLELGEPK